MFHFIAKNFILTNKKKKNQHNLKILIRNKQKLFIIIIGNINSNGQWLQNLNYKRNSDKKINKNNPPQNNSTQPI